MMVDRIDTASTSSSGGAVMENSFGLARVLGRVFPGRFFVGASGSVVFGFGVSSFLRLARTSVLLTLSVTSLLTVFIATSNATNLPDGRGYELVSPPDKNGGDVMADSQRVRVAADGNAVSFPSLRGFSDVAGTAYATEYLAQRSQMASPGNSGWRVHGITPKQAPLPLLGLAIDPEYLGDGDPSLNAGVFRGWSPLTNDPNVANVANLYVRTDLRKQGTGSYKLLTGCPLCAIASAPLAPLVVFAAGQLPALAGTSTDQSHIVFESRLKLTADAPGTDCSTSGPPGGAPINSEGQCATKLYESDHGVVRLAGILPDGAPAPNSVAGQGTGPSHGGSGRLAPHVISSDGTRIFFTVPAAAGATSGALYMRTDNGAPDAATVQLNASESTTADPNGPQSATYWDASADGSRVVFTSTEALTNDATSGLDNLYLYNAAKPGSDAHNLTLLNVDRHGGAGSESPGAIGMSRDGHYIYFISIGQIVAGQPGISGDGWGVYVWHDNAGAPRVDYVAAMTNAGDQLDDLVTVNVGLRTMQARVSADGSHLLFSETNAGVGPTGYDQGNCNGSNTGLGCRELYVYDANAKQLECASCRPDGVAATVDAIDVIRTNVTAATTTMHLNHPLSTDGQHVFFTTAEPLVPEDINGKLDVYAYDVPSKTVHLISSGQDAADSYFMDASESGNDVFFLTRAKLVGWDTDNNYDLYDARVDGGFPEPQIAPPGCSGDSCHGALTVPPSLTTPGSSTLLGIGNLKPASKKVSKSASKSQKLKKALKACKSKRSKAKRKKCESSARKRFGKSGGSK
jgi:Tol biopolymer transport system component